MTALRPVPAHFFSGSKKPYALGAYELAHVCDAVKNDQTVVVFSLSHSILRTLGNRLGAMQGSPIDMLRLMGVDEVFEQDCCWDDLAHAEACELLERIDAPSAPPLLIHACPKWAQAVRASHPEMSSCFTSAALCSQRQGLAARAIVSARRGIPPACVTHVTVVSCPARKNELLGIGFDAQICGGPEYVLTVREVANWLVSAGVAKADARFGVQASAPVHKGRLRDVLAHAVLLSNGTPPPHDFLSLVPSPDYAALEEGEVLLGRRPVRVALIHGTDNAYALWERISRGQARYDLVEVLSCASGCQ